MLDFVKMQGFICKIICVILLGLRVALNIQGPICKTASVSRPADRLIQPPIFSDVDISVGHK
jgi:hypothetical protein